MFNIRKCTKKDNPNCITDEKQLNDYLKTIYVRVGSYQYEVDLTNNTRFKDGHDPIGEFQKTDSDIYHLELGMQR